MLHAAEAQDIDATLDDIALGDAAEIDPHAFLQEMDGPGRLVEFHETEINILAFGFDCRIVRPLAAAEIVILADAVIGDVERSEGQDRDIERATNEVEQLAAGHYRPFCRQAINLRNTAVLDIRAHQLVDALRLREYGLDEFFAPSDVLVPQAHADLGTHEWPRIADPPGLGGRRNGENRHHS